MEDFEIKNDEIQKILKDLGNSIARILPKGWGFNLLIFNFGKKGAMFYLSNADRKDMIAAMKEFISNEEKKND